VTVVALIPIVPRALSLPGVERLNQELQKELTRRRETAESLRASEDSFRLLVDGTRDYAILKLDRQGHVVNWNPGAQRIYGYDSDEIIGRHFSCFYSAEDVTRGKPQGELDTALANGQYSEEGLCIRKDGAEYWAQVTITAMFDRAGNHVGFWKITRDISERKRAERELRDSEVRIRSIVETAVDAIVTIDHRGAIDSFNPSAERLFGYSAREVLGQNVKMLMPPPFSAEHDQYIVNFLTTGVKKIIGIGREVTGLRKDGAAFPMELAVSEMVIGDKRMFTGIVRDISERKRAQQDLHTLNEELEKRVRRRTEQLEAVNSELEAFSYSVSHDLRAPVRALVGFSKILLEEHAARLNEEMNHSLQRIHENAEQMGRLVDDLLAFSRLGRRAVSKQHLHPGDMVQRIIDNLSTANADRQLRFHVGELPECQADAALLQQVFTNVLDNAVKYTRKRDAAEIEVGGEKRDGECVYFVRDNGAGFDMRYADKLFGVFQRLHRAEEFEGTGVGLAIVQRIIQRHGGRVWAEAAVDQGAKFTFTLPETAHD
jgi:PAS domain S-box-containing protein